MNGSESVSASSSEGNAGAARIDSSSELNGLKRAASRIEFEEVEPWDETVDGEHLLFELLRILKRFLVIDPPARIAIVLWIVHTYLFGYFDVTPILSVLSPERRCGKTTLLALLECLVHRPLLAANITPAALFRAVEATRPTVLIDELDNKLGSRSELKYLLNAGHRRGSDVIRADGPGRSVRGYHVFGPKVLALIGSLPSTLQDRSIVVGMKRRGAGDGEVERFRFASVHEQLKPVRRKLLRWAKDNGARVTLSNAEDLEPLNARAQDNWRPLLAIAELCGPVWKEQARKAALTLSGSWHEDPLGIMLLEDIREIIRQRKGTDRIPSSELAGWLASFEDRPWFDWSGPKGFTAHQLARLLAPFGIRPKPLWRGSSNSVVRGYRFEQFEDAFSRYLEPLPRMQGSLPQDPLKPKFRPAFRK